MWRLRRRNSAQSSHHGICELHAHSLSLASPSGTVENSTPVCVERTSIVNDCTERTSSRSNVASTLHSLLGKLDRTKLRENVVGPGKRGVIEK